MEEQTAALQRVCMVTGVDPDFVPFGVCEDNFAFKDIGSGYVMFFKLISFMAFAFLLFAVMNLFKVASNVQGKSCGATLVACSKDWITTPSAANYSSFGVLEADMTERTWMFIFFLAFWLYLAGIKVYFTRLDKEIDARTDVPSDWTIRVEGLPKDESADDIKKYFERNFAADNIRVKKISLSYHIEEYREQENKVLEFRKQIRGEQIKEMELYFVKEKEELDKKKQAARIKAEEAKVKEDRDIKEGKKTKKQEGKEPEKEVEAQKVDVDFNRKIKVENFSPEFQKRFKELKDLMTKVTVK